MSGNDIMDDEDSLEEESLEIDDEDEAEGGMVASVVKAADLSDGSSNGGSPTHGRSLARRRFSFNRENGGASQECIDRTDADEEGTRRRRSDKFSDKTNPRSWMHDDRGASRSRRGGGFGGPDGSTWRTREQGEWRRSSAADSGGKWSHDKFDDTQRSPSPERDDRPRYRSRDGGSGAGSRFVAYAGERRRDFDHVSDRLRGRLGARDGNSAGKARDGCGRISGGSRERRSGGPGRDSGGGDATSGWRQRPRSVATNMASSPDRHSRRDSDRDPDRRNTSSRERRR